jgi:hypothetical protein
MEAKKDNHYEEENTFIVTYLSEKERKARYAQILAEKHNVKRIQHKTKINYVLPFMKYAAVGLLLMASIFLTRQTLVKDSTDQMALDYIRDTRILGDPSSMRKDNAYIEQLRIDANYAFINQNFDESARLYSKIVTSDKVENSDFLYLGISYLRANPSQPKAAIDAFDKVNVDSSVSKETKWFKALAYLVDKNHPSAKSLLSEIVEANGYKHREAATLLSHLK